MNPSYLLINSLVSNPTTTTPTTETAFTSPKIHPTTKNYTPREREMAVHELQSNKVFLRSPDKGFLTIYELELDAPNSYAVKTGNWNFVAVVAPKRDTLRVNGASISAHMLQKLQKDLRRGRPSVNREGLCYIAREGITHALFDLEYYRLNDLFSWSDYVNDQDNQVNQAVETAWNRCDMRKGDVLVDYEEMENELQELMQSLREKEEELNKLKEEVKMLRQQHSSTSSELQSRKEDIKKKADELKKMEEECGTLRQQLDSTEADLRSRKEDLRKKEKEFKRVEAEYKTLQQQLSSTEADLEEIKQELEKKKKELKISEQVRSTQTRLLEKEIEEKEKKLEQAEEEYNTLRKDLWSTEAELKMKKKEVEAQRKELNKVQEKSTELQRNLTYSETELRLRKGQLEKVNEESQTKKEESDSLFRQLSSAQAELKFTKEDLDEKVKELENVKEEAKTLGKKYSIIETELKRELKLKDKELKEVKDQLSSAQAKLKSTIEEVEAKLKSRIEEVDKKDKELESLAEKVRELEEELERNGLSSTAGRTCVDIFLDIVLRRRLPLAPEEFKNFPGDLNREAFIFPPKGETPRIYTPLDTDRHERRGVHLNLARYTSDRQWDKKNWWLITVTGHKSGPFTIAYYGGNFDSTEAYGTPVSIPFHKGAIFKRDGDDQVGFVRGIGMRFLTTFKTHE